MVIASVALASFGIFATAFVAWLVHKKTNKLLKQIDTILRRINAIQVARSTPSELKVLHRLIEDWERTGVKRGTLAQTPGCQCKKGTWKIDWTPLDGTPLDGTIL